MARCKSVYEKPDPKTGKPIRCNKNARRQHDICKNGGYEWENKIGFVPKKKREKKSRVEESDGAMVRAVAKYRTMRNKKRK